MQKENKKLYKVSGYLKKYNDVYYSEKITVLYIFAESPYKAKCKFFKLCIKNDKEYYLHNVRCKLIKLLTEKTVKINK